MCKPSFSFLFIPFLKRKEVSSSFLSIFHFFKNFLTVVYLLSFYNLVSDQVDVIFLQSSSVMFDSFLFVLRLS